MSSSAILPDMMLATSLSSSARDWAAASRIASWGRSGVLALSIAVRCVCVVLGAQASTLTDFRDCSRSSVWPREGGVRRAWSKGAAGVEARKVCAVPAGQREAVVRREAVWTRGPKTCPNTNTSFFPSLKFRLQRVFRCTQLREKWRVAPVICGKGVIS